MIKTEYYRYGESSFQKIPNPLIDYPPDGDFYNEPEKAGYLRQCWRKSLPSICSVYRQVRGRRNLPAYLVEVRSNYGRLAWYTAKNLNEVMETIKRLEPLQGFVT